MPGIRTGRRTARRSSMDSASTSSLEKKLVDLSMESLGRYETRDMELAGEAPVVANRRKLP